MLSAAGAMRGLRALPRGRAVLRKPLVSAGRRGAASRSASVGALRGARRGGVLRFFSSSSSSSSAAGDATYDCVVVGGGPGGYVAAIRAAQLGLKTACVEGRGALGGTCLNVGCIPSKALLNISHKYEEAQKHFSEMGIEIDGQVSLDLAKMMKRKEASVTGLTKGIEGLFKKNKVTYARGYGKLVADGRQVEVTKDDGSKEVLSAKNVVLATGSVPSSVPGVDIDEKRIVSSTGALELPEVPKNLIVVGGGVIGLELGSVWARLGAKVTVVEFLDRIVPGCDLEVAKTFQRILKGQGLDFKLSTKVTSSTPSDSGVKLTVAPAKGDGKEETLEADYVLVATGRKPFTEGLGLEDVGVAMDGQRVAVDDHLRTNLPGVWAIGDVVRGPMLAHKAEEEGVAVADTLATGKGHVNYDAIPGVVYTWPEVAQVGKTEEELKAEGVDYRAGKFPFMANSRARTNNDSDGLVKVLVDKKTDRILGAHIVGPDAGELIGELVLGMEYGASAEDIARTCHAHPTLSEAVKEACLAAYFKPIHM